MDIRCSMSYIAELLTAVLRVYACFCLLSGTMSTATSQQPPKDDEEEEDEEQGEEFEFDDSTDEEKIQEDSKRIDPVQLTEEKSSGMLTVAGTAELPAGQEVALTKVLVPSAGETNNVLYLKLNHFYLP